MAGVAVAGLLSARGQAVLDKIDDALTWESPKRKVRLDLSGLLEAETYRVDQRPPGLLFSNDEYYFNPRLSLFGDARFGPHFYAFTQVRIDRGFDPGSEDWDARFDEYFLRYTPWEDGRVNFQAGKFATVAGNWVARHDSWQNPFITAPLPYENVMVVGDLAGPPSAAQFRGRRAGDDQKSKWLPVLWGPSYASGASVFGRLEKFDYAFEVKNAALSSRPDSWNAFDFGWENPTVTGRVGLRPNASWNAGVSGSFGSYLQPSASASLSSGKDVGDYRQITVGQDISYARHHWQFWGEIFLSRFEVPYVGNADTLAYYLEAKYKITTQLFAAMRWNQQLFGEIPNGRGGQESWDNDIWRTDFSVGYRFTRHIQAKLQYSYSEQEGGRQQGQQLVAGQVTVKF